jgi:hypothetical protein
MRPARACLLLSSVVAASLVARQARAEELDPERTELAGVPVVAGNSDIGLQVGIVGSATRFHGDARPFWWKLDAVASSSGKIDDAGFRLVQHSYLVRLETPALLGGRLRADVRASARRTINSGYYGLGNAAPAPPRDADHRLYEYVHQEGRLHAIGRVRTGTPVDAAFAVNLRYVDPELYLGSKVSQDAAVLRGTDRAALGSLAGGIMIDTRDEEFVTTRGLFYQLGVSGTAGTAAVGSGEASASLAHYIQLAGPLIFAQRVIASLQFGHPPFYDMQEGGVFDQRWLFGGDNGVRGVPRGRYTGKIKALANHELRLLLPRFRLLGQRLRPGITALFDAGRLWADYAADPARDGTKLGLKYGIGGGVFGQWGEAAIVRADVAYSPDAVSENRSFPVGLYVTTGLMF